MAESSKKGKKTLWEKEKLHVTSNFSFSHSVFKKLLRQTRACLGKGYRSLDMVSISPFPHSVFKRFVLQTCKKGLVLERVKGIYLGNRRRL